MQYFGIALPRNLFRIKVEHFALVTFGSVLESLLLMLCIHVNVL